MKLTLSIKKSVEENAEIYFEKAKKARKKLEGAKKALEDSKVELVKAESEEAKKLAEADELKLEQVRKQERKAKKEWFENFRWFISSEGFLVIGGRDATTNEIVIKKHTDKEDVVCHTDMSGSPFFVVKKNSQPDKEIGEVTIQEAIDATFCFSRAWKMGLMTANIFHVKPEQVTKEANSGEFLPKGAFMIRGKTNYLPPNNDCAIGVDEKGRFMGGPLAAIEKNCKDFVALEQGREKPSDIAKLVRKIMGGEPDDIIRALPPGNISIKKLQKKYVPKAKKKVSKKK